ncbi:MAG: hypothetical protein IT329_12185 [Caldilineaceae bacterium]|nr:hypothetical protein [Caldilineaceae bacterium]
MLRHRWFVILVIGLFFLLMGNSPAPWYACEGKAIGDPCQYGYACSNNGKCIASPQENCVDDPDTSVNECVICSSGAAMVEH